MVDENPGEKEEPKKEQPLKEPKPKPQEPAELTEPKTPEEPKKEPEKPKTYWYVYVGLFIIVFAAIFFSLQWIGGEGTYNVAWGGEVQYHSRPPAQFMRLANETQENVTIEKVIITSKDLDVYGLLAIPHNRIRRLPAIVVMPGAGVSKEGEQNGLSADLNRLGFITLTLDLRGSGETGGKLLPIEFEIELFREKVETPTHKSFYDVLRAYDTLKALPEVDPNNIYIAGESLGGRYALIIGGMEPGIKGVLAISTGGFTFTQSLDHVVNQYLASANPNTYVNKIQELVMIHSRNDSVVDVREAQETFDRGPEGKSLFLIDKPGHGYDSGEMFGFVNATLVGWR